MSIASELQDKINSKDAIKAAIEAKGVTVGDVKLNQYASKIDEIEQGGGDPSIPVGTGQHLVTFYDFDGKVLKRERVATGGNATAPDIPIHEFLTFAEWNNPFTNVQSDIDTGAIYNTTDGKTYLFITLTAVTGLAPTLYFSKNSTSLMTIDWGDGTTSTSTTNGYQSIQHTYVTAGDYIITVDNSAGGTYTLNDPDSIKSPFDYKCLNKVYIGNNMAFRIRQFQNSNGLKNVSISKNTITLPERFFSGCTSLEFCSFPSTYIVGTILVFYNCHSLTKVVLSNFISTNLCFYLNYGLRIIIFPSTLTLIGASTFTNCYAIKQYIFLSTTPPTLANINAFTGINPICKIYVPDASVEAYKTATNWVTYANYIYPLSQKPQSDE